MSLSGILNALSSILSRKQDEVPEFLGYDVDLLETLGQKPVEKYLLHEYLLSGLKGIMFGVLMVWGILMNGKTSQKQIFIPKAYLERLRETAIAELKLGGDPKEHRGAMISPDDYFMSESDVLLAWWTRIVVLGLKARQKNAPIAIMNILDYRGLLDGELLKKGGVYIGNATMAISTYLPACQILHSPLSAVAIALRRSLVQQRTRPQLEAVAALQRQALKSSTYPAFFGPVRCFLIACSNWNRGKLFDVNFSSALAKPTSGEGGLEGKPSYIHVVGFNNGFPLTNMGPMFGKDHAGNWWMSWYTSDSTWKVIEEEFKEME